MCAVVLSTQPNLRQLAVGYLPLFCIILPVAQNLVMTNLEECLAARWSFL